MVKVLLVTFCQLNEKTILREGVDFCHCLCNVIRDALIHHTSSSAYFLQLGKNSRAPLKMLFAMPGI